MSNDHLNSQPTFKNTAYKCTHEGLLRELDFVKQAHTFLCSHPDEELPLTTDSLRCYS